MIALWQRLLLVLCDGQRKGEEGTCVSMTTHLRVALYKARRGGGERRANRYWHSVEEGEAHAACWLKQDPMRSFRAEPACRQRPRLRNISISIAFHQQAAGCHANGRHNPPPPPSPRVTHPQTQRTCSSIRQTGPKAARLKPDAEWSGTHRECESGRGPPAGGTSPGAFFANPHLTTLH